MEVHCDGGGVALRPPSSLQPRLCHKPFLASNSSIFTASSLQTPSSLHTPPSCGGDGGIAVRTEGSVVRMAVKMEEFVRMEGLY